MNALKIYYMRGDFMRMVKNIMKLMVIIMIIASLFGCSAKIDLQVSDEPQVTDKPQVSNEPQVSDEQQKVDDSDAEHKDSDDRTQYANVFDFDSLDTHPMFAVAFLGYGDMMDARHTYVEETFADLGDFAIEQVGHIDYEGDEWYLIVPRYKEDVDITNLDTGEVHTISNGEAFTVKCNLSDLHSNIEISTELNLIGHKFSPQIGGDGKLVPNPDVWDITDYIMEGE